MTPSDPSDIPPVTKVSKSFPKSEGNRPPSSRKQSATVPEPTDPVILSDSGKEHQILHDTIKAIPEIRQDKVERIRSAIDSGQYRVKSDLVAARIIQDTILHRPQKNH